MTQEKWQDTLISIKIRCSPPAMQKSQLPLSSSPSSPVPAAATISTSAIWPAMKSKSPLWPI